LVSKAAGGAFSDQAPVRGFGLAGEDGKFVWVDAAIAGDTVVLSSEKVPRPVKARYGWANHPDGNLFNRDGLPAGPFELNVMTAAAKDTRNVP
jgi:sialate O-acetylesterase